jgi:hypothetical protein
MQLLRDMGGLLQCLSAVAVGIVDGFNQVESPTIVGFYQETIYRVTLKGGSSI